MDIRKHLIITGNSTVSWKDAIVKTITETSQTIKKLNSVEILKQKAIISGDKITEYQVDLDITFKIDSSKRQCQTDDSDLN